MSWLAKNYEKVALGGAAVVALGLGWLGWSKMGAVETDFATSLKGRGNNNSAVQGAELIPKAMQSLKLDHSWTQSRDGDRPVDLFTGIALFVKSSEPEKPVDLLTGENVHPPIPNTWWIENRLDPGFADSPLRDPDEDGFTNLEEFNGSTDPNAFKSHPPLIAKLTYVKDDSLTWVIRPGFGGGGKFPFTYEDSKGRRNRVPAAEMIGADEIFFKEEPAKDRFKLLGHEVRKIPNPRTNVDDQVTIVRIEDQRHNKKGTVYEFPSPLPDDERKLQHVKYDRTAVLTLEALGLGGKEFMVEENTPFALPQDAPKKDYLLKSVTPEEIVVEYADAQGARQTVSIAKGSFPNLAP